MFNFIEPHKFITMRIAKSEPKLKFSVNSIDNFFSEKNFNGEMYMDNEEEERLAMENALRKKSQSTLFVPKAKLTYNLHERADTVLSKNKKIGVLQKDNNKKAIAKISYTSTLPPIKTQQK